MLLKGPLIGALLLLVIARWWAKRSIRFRWGALVVGWLVVAAQAVSAGRQTWGQSPEPTSAILGAWVILAILGAAVFWLQRDTRPMLREDGSRGPARSRTGSDRRPRPAGSNARVAGRAVRNAMGLDRKR